MIEIAVFVFLGWILSLCLHEFGHAIAAYYGGDTSVKEKGYLTLNPLKYVDPVLTLIMPMIFLLMGGIGLPGAAVYINSSQIRNRLWLSLTSIAGPLASLVSALILVVIYKFSVSQLSQVSLAELSELKYASQLPTDVLFQMYMSEISKHWFIFGLSILIYLEVFSVMLNLLPIPSLDGYGVIEPWLPRSWQTKLEPVKKYGFAIFLALFWFLPTFSRQFSRWVMQLTGLFDIDASYIGTGFTLFQKASTPMAVAILVIFIIIRKLTIKKHEALYEHALAHQRSRKLDAALRDVEKAIAIQPDFSKGLLLKADILYDRQDYAAAASIWEAHLSAHPHDVDVQQNSIRALGNLGRNEEALDLCDRLLFDNPHNAYIWRLKVWILHHLQDDRRVLEACDRGIAIKPDEVYFWTVKAEIFAGRESWQEALQAYQKVTEIDRRDISAWISQSKILIKLNQLENALACSDRALQIDPRELDSLHYHSYILCLLHRLDEAIEFLDRILRIDPKRSNAFYNKACCYAESEQLDFAIANLKSAILYDSSLELKEQAKTDDSFAKIRDTSEFQQLLA
jgi:tetratricopeptide (TPR) repeat protein